MSQGQGSRGQSYNLVLSSEMFACCEISASLAEVTWLRRLACPMINSLATHAFGIAVRVRITRAIASLRTSPLRRRANSWTPRPKMLQSQGENPTRLGLVVRLTDTAIHLPTEAQLLSRAIQQPEHLLATWATHRAPVPPRHSPWPPPAGASAARSAGAHRHRRAAPVRRARRAVRTTRRALRRRHTSDSCSSGSQRAVAPAARFPPGQGSGEWSRSTRQSSRAPL